MDANMPNVETQFLICQLQAALSLPVFRGVNICDLDEVQFVTILMVSMQGISKATRFTLYILF